MESDGLPIVVDELSPIQNLPRPAITNRSKTTIQAAAKRRFDWVITFLPLVNSPEFRLIPIPSSWADSWIVLFLSYANPSSAMWQPAREKAGNKIPISRFIVGRLAQVGCGLSLDPKRRKLIAKRASFIVRSHHNSGGFENVPRPHSHPLPS